MTNMAFRNDSPVSVFDDRILHIDLNEWTEFKTTKELYGEEVMGSFSSGNDNDDDDLCSSPRAPSMAMEAGEQENFFPVAPTSLHNHSTLSLQSDETTDASSSSDSSNDAYSSRDEDLSFPTECQVSDESKHLTHS